MEETPVVALISAFKAPFVEDDIATLRKEFTVRPSIGSGMRQLFSIFRSVLRADVVVCWFASTYAAFAVWLCRRLRKPIVVIVGGADVAKREDLKYGMWTHPLKSRCAGYALRNSSRVLAVDESLAREASERARYDGKNIRTVPTGYDSAFWKPLGPKESLVLTVAVVRDRTRLKVKGIDLLLEAASMLPDVRFRLIGLSSSVVEGDNIPANVELLREMERERLLDHYREAGYYCQPSRREGLSNALCEAMLCECIPVATDVGGTRRVVADTGIVVAPESASALANGIRSVIRVPSEKGRLARARVSALLPRERRAEELYGTIRALLG